MEEINGQTDRQALQDLAVREEKIELEPRKEYVWLQALGDLIAQAIQLQNEIKNDLLCSEIAPAATVWNPEEFDEIKRSIQTQSELAESGTSS